MNYEVLVQIKGYTLPTKDLRKQYCRHYSGHKNSAKMLEGLLLQPAPPPSHPHHPQSWQSYGCFYFVFDLKLDLPLKVVKYLPQTHIVCLGAQYSDQEPNQAKYLLHKMHCILIPPSNTYVCLGAHNSDREPNQAKYLLPKIHCILIPPFKIYVCLGARNSDQEPNQAKHVTQDALYSVRNCGSGSVYNPNCLCHRLTHHVATLS